MKKVKDFTYYGKKRMKVQRFMKMLNEQKYSMPYFLIPSTLYALIFYIENNFSFSLSIMGVVLSSIFFYYLSYYIFLIISYFVCVYLDKYYFRKCTELLEKYIQEKGIKNSIIGDKNDKVY